MTKKMKSTVDELIESLSSEERKKYDEEYKEFLLSELILAAMAKDDEAVKTLAKMAGVSPAIKDFNLQSFFKILKGLGSKGFMVELHGKYIPLDMPVSRKK